MTELILIVALSIATLVLFVLLFVERKKRNKISNGVIQKISSVNRDGSADSPGELTRYLRLKNCDQLMPELLKKLKAESRISKVGFYMKSGQRDNDIIAYRLNIMDKTDNILRNNYQQIIEKLHTGDFVKINDLNNPGLFPDESRSEIEKEGIDYLVSIPWLDNKRAMLALGEGAVTGDLSEHVNRFRQESIPLVENISRFEQAEALSHTDSLTGTYNHRYFKKRLREEFYRARRYERFLALMILDIDELKVVNDKYGHLAGDSLINSFVTVLSNSVRSNDIICRYGGDEFCLIMPEIDRGHARLFMERIRNAIAAHTIDIEGIYENPNLTVSIGGAVYPVDTDSIEGLIKAADMALLKAKQEGRNRAILFRGDYDITT